VPGGTFSRDGNASYPATISGFRLDKYLVTVGRFRAFITAGASAWSPAVGAGIHTHLNGGQGLVNSGTTPPEYEQGWLASWTPAATGMATTVSGWNTHLGGGTWTQNASSSDDLPITEVTWWEAYAFCIWDGGFLPSEAEFNYAFMGGSQERQYPWDATSTAISCSDANYSGCPAGAANAVGSESPAGDGLWGQSDLAGNVWEWLLDWYESPYSTASCNNCADATDTGAFDRVIRGGSFGSGAAGLLASYRDYLYPSDRVYSLGFRCARTP
jgi:formylglycine-generating enzyme required for sulfatase activity